MRESHLRKRNLIITTLHNFIRKPQRATYNESYTAVSWDSKILYIFRKSNRIQLLSKYCKSNNKIFFFEPSETSIISKLQYFESLFEYSEIASLKNFSLILPTHRILTFIGYILAHLNDLDNIKDTPAVTCLSKGE